MITSQNKSFVFAARLQRQLYQLVRTYELCDQACLAQNGVTASQGYTLLSLPQEGTLSMNDLSEAMGLAGSTMTRYVDELVRKGFVQRKPDAEDRRVVRVELTNQGREVRSILEGALQDFYKQVLDEIPPDERVALLHALDLVSQAITKVFNSCCVS